MTHPATPLDDLRRTSGLIVMARPHLFEAYQALWTEIWGVLRVKWGVPAKAVNEEVRAVLLGFLVDGVPVDTARMVATEYMRGLSHD